MTSAFATLAMINLDADSPSGQAAFYSQILGWDVLHSADEYAMIGDGTTSIGWGKVPGYSAPGWPDEATPKRYHLDFYVDDLDKAEASALSLGASRPDTQPEPERWRVLLDPEGHPFDLCLRSRPQTSRSSSSSGRSGVVRTDRRSRRGPVRAATRFACVAALRATCVSGHPRR